MSAAPDRLEINNIVESAKFAKTHVNNVELVSFDETGYTEHNNTTFVTIAVKLIKYKRVFSCYRTTFDPVLQRAPVHASVVGRLQPCYA